MAIRLYVCTNIEIFFCCPSHIPLFFQILMTPTNIRSASNKQGCNAPPPLSHNTPPFTGYKNVTHKQESSLFGE